MITGTLFSYKSVHAQALLKSQGRWLLVLPPYTPDLYPIEMAYSKLQAHLRRLMAPTCDDLVHSVAQTCDRFPPDACTDLFKAAGCVAD